MAILTNDQRQEIWAGLMRDLSSRSEAIGLTKAELRAALDATDAWINDNAAAYNAALPLPARTALSAQQKAELFLFVARKRYEVS